MLNLPIAVLFSLALINTSRPPTPYIDKGACPFEGCIYREWIALKAIRLLDRPNGKRVVGMIHQGEHVIGLTGEVHCMPVLVHALEDVPDPQNLRHIVVRKGEAFYLLHRLGEGYWLGWYKGKLIDVDEFSNPGKVPQAVWWVKVKTPSGLAGWTISDGNFAGQDSLS